ncbi:hypothetical protein Val02_25020 [Virgisporangium aliadipatigenens]|uniref:HTH cro/C1-type domain-containing protein n=1 Tax=Virgisporangium aliadipatigenens TaxID=741659 RepID=A0A8J3YIC7_9ACTN|nr:helix-turn-helix transcriptional regulator [Virgisporangium aliadipatigenens]GIJ45616.1 hypothetical protein Val02_25020 [Virgisporangium aliadipatigenens]
MNVSGRPLDPAVLDALRHWPDTGHAEPSAPVDLAVLLPFLNGLLDELPWWDRAWRVTRAGPAYPRGAGGTEPFVDVYVPGMVHSGVGQPLPFSARVRLDGDRLLSVQAKVGTTLIEPGHVEARQSQSQPHPFGAVLGRLMDIRQVTTMELAMRTGRARSTVTAVRHGGRPPTPDLVRRIARALDIPEADLAAIAGVEPDPL